MSKGNPSWKVAFAVLSLVLSILVWTKGLQESFNRPSVNPQISLHQREISVLAEKALPPAFSSTLIGLDPKYELKQSLEKLSFDEISERNRVLLSSLKPSQEDRESILSGPFISNDLNFIKSALLNPSKIDSTFLEDLKNLKEIKNDPLLYQLTCSSFLDDDDICIDLKLSQSMAARLMISQLFPFIAVLSGSVLLLRQAWIVIKGKTIPWPKLISLPLSIVDMIILIAGGFVALGEVIVPVIVLPITIALTKGLDQPIGDSVKVLIGYSAMTLPPLLILRQQFKSISSLEVPQGGWLQWKWNSFDKAIYKAIQAWLMVMPLVLLVGWLVRLAFGDQGGSNPLLELVLNSQDPFALALLVFTTVVLAPLFEELVFRGVLLPVLAKGLGPSLAILVSAFVFAIAHLSVGELPPLFVLGVGLGILRLSSGSLLSSVLMHSFWNGVTFLSLLLIGA